MVRYISTRGGAEPVGFSQAVTAGLAPDGGLYTPQAWPSFSPDEIGAFAGRPYAEVAARVLNLLAGDDLSTDLCERLTAEAYAPFAHPAVTPLRELDAGLWLLELFHGPTLAFKDVAMQFLARLYDHLLTLQGRRLTLVVATSGDTGGAAVEAFAGASNVRLLVLFPEGRISEVQRRFMTTTQASNIACVSVDGTFDDCQALVKALFADEALRREVDLSGVNSINFGRIAAQAVYFFTSAAALGAPHRPAHYVVPTGNFGDAFAGYAAHRLGLPLAGITVATNGNAILAHTFQTGRYAKGAVLETQSPAMDIQVASNFERLYFEAVGRDGPETARAFADFNATGALDMPSQAFESVRGLFTGAQVGEAETAEAMALAWRAGMGVLDPHTAVGLAAARRTRHAEPVILLSTAHPAKFPEAVHAATGQAAAHPRAQALADAPERIDRLPADLAAVSAYLRAFAGRGA